MSMNLFLLFRILWSFSGRRTIFFLQVIWRCLFWVVILKRLVDDTFWMAGMLEWWLFGGYTLFMFCTYSQNNYPVNHVKSDKKFQSLFEFTKLRYKISIKNSKILLWFLWGTVRNHKWMNMLWHNKEDMKAVSGLLYKII